MRDDDINWIGCLQEQMLRSSKADGHRVDQVLIDLWP